MIARIALVLGMVLFGFAADAGQPPGIPMSFFGAPSGVATLDGNSNVPSANLANAQKKPRPVCNNTSWNTNIGGTAGYTADSRLVLYCPQGFSSLQLEFSGVYLLPGETDLGTPVPMSIGVEVPIPAPWSPTASYAAGQTVSYFSNLTTNNSPNWQALSANTNSAPAPSNTAWETAPSANSLYLVTCGGQPTCTLAGQTTGAGTAVTQGYLLTDPLPVTCPVGCFIAIRIHSYIGATAHLLSSVGGQPYFGGYLVSGAATTDRSTTASSYGPNEGPQSGQIAPVGAIGIPLVAKPTVCVLGDSRTAGTVGYGLGNTATVSSGGSGYTSADVGDILPISTAGGSSGSVGVPGTLLIYGVTSGAVASVKIMTTGSFTNTGINTNQTLPSTTQTAVGGNGTGLTVTVGYQSFGLDTGDYYGSTGMINRGLSEAGIAYVPFEVSGDELYYWVNLRDYTRLNMIAQSGCSSAIIALGINDVTSGYTAAQMESWYTTLASQLQSVGVLKVYLATIPPADASTDGFITTTNQTPRTGVSTVRTALNDWMRTTPTGFAGYFDLANAVESSQDSGFWKVNSATACYYTCDGTHPTPIGDAAIAAVITANAGMLR